jgi:hypothetical protein
MTQSIGTQDVLSKQLESISATNKKTSRSSKDTSSGNSADKVNVHMKDVYKSLTILGDEIIKKLDELIASDVPGGIASLNPEDHTAEKTADRIVAGVTGLLPAFARQNPELEGEELINSFMETVKGGIKEGYKSAMGTLGELGAFKFDGVEAGIEKTMSLVDEKLNAFKEQFLKDNGLAAAKVEEVDAMTQAPEAEVTEVNEEA